MRRTKSFQSSDKTRVINERVESASLDLEDQREQAIHRVCGLLKDGLASGQGREDSVEDHRKLLAIARGQIEAKGLGRSGEQGAEGAHASVAEDPGICRRS